MSNNNIHTKEDLFASKTNRKLDIHNRYQYTSNLYGEVPISFEATVLDVHYTINDEGKINLHVKTDIDYDLKGVINITRSGTKQVENIYNIDTIKKGDIYRIVLQEDNNYSKYYWVWVPVDIDTDRTDAFITDVNRVHSCPVCGEELTSINRDKYCLNDQCPAKIKFAIRRFLQKATFEKWYIEDIVTFDKLITIGRINNIADIYTLTADEINSLESYFVESENNRGEYLVNKINRTRGTVTLFNFLNALCVPKVEGYSLKKEYIDKLQSIDNFLELISDFEYDHKYRVCLTKVAAHVLRNYFNKDSTMEYITRLIDENVFEF